MKYSMKSLWSLKAMLTAAVPAAALVLSLSVSPAQAANPIVFNFDTAALRTTTGVSTIPPDDSATVASYMNGLLAVAPGSSCPGPNCWTVAISGAASSGGDTAHPSPGYAADGNVVCASGSGSGCTPNTLSTKDNTPFIMTSGSYAVNSSFVSVTPGSTGADNAINMVFTGGVKVNSLTFDFEIFPDNSCLTGSCGAANIPDFTFLMTGTGATMSAVTVSGQVPGVAGTDCPAASDLKSQTSGSGNELAPQCLGSMTFTFATVTNPTLYFVDWPATIAVTNIDWGLPGVPEPGSLLLFGSGLVGLALVRRLRARKV
jgi:hypothetical protein